MTRQKILRTGALVILILAYTIGVCMLESCSRSRSDSDDKASQNLHSKAEVARLDLVLAGYSGLDSAGRANVRESFSAPLGVLLGMHGYSRVSDSALVSYSRSAAVKVFSPDAMAKYPEDTKMIDTLAVTAANIDRISGKDVNTRIFTIVTPFNQSVITADSIVFVGLNHYLGENYPGYEGVVASYLLPRKTRTFLPYALAEGMLMAKFPYSPRRTSDLLSRMLFEGAIVYAAVQSVPDGNVADALAWNHSQYVWAETHEAQVWNAIIGRNLLFSTSDTDAVRLLAPTPKSVIISPDAPGQIGRFIGYCIVESYMKNHPDVTLKFLLSPEFYSADNTLEEADYHPR